MVDAFWLSKQTYIMNVFWVFLTASPECICILPQGLELSYRATEQSVGGKFLRFWRKAARDGIREISAKLCSEPKENDYCACASSVF